MATREEGSLVIDSSSQKGSATKSNLLLLPPEIRLKIYAFLLALPSLIVEPMYNVQTHPFRLKTTYPLTTQILRVCKKITSEAIPVLYASHSFMCSFDALGVDELLAQIGPYNFTFIRRLVVDWVDIPRIAISLQKGDYASLYRNLETLTITTYVQIDLNRPEKRLNSDLSDLLEKSLHARAITQQHATLKVVEQTCARTNRRVAEDDCTDVRIYWRFMRPHDMLRSNVSPSVQFLFSQSSFAFVEH